MEYAFVKQAKTGELAEGENPFNVIRIGAESVDELAEKKIHYLTDGYEAADESEWTAEEGEDHQEFESTIIEGESSQVVDKTPTKETE